MSTIFHKSYAYRDDQPKGSSTQSQIDTAAQEHALEAERDTLQHILNRLRVQSLPGACICIYHTNGRVEVVEDPHSSKGSHHLKLHIHQILIINTLHKKHHTVEVTLSKRHQDVFREGHPISIPGGRDKWSIGKINWIDDTVFTAALTEYVHTLHVTDTHQAESHQEKKLTPEKQTKSIKSNEEERPSKVSYQALVESERSAFELNQKHEKKMRHQREGQEGIDENIRKANKSKSH